MTPMIQEIRAKNILTKTGIPGMRYCINPYVGCEHACRYCYATFMKRFTGHTETWGSFVDVKINAPEMLRKQLRRAEKGPIIISSVTDPYQPAEETYGITRKCLEVLVQFQYPVSILTKSPLVVRDIDLISELKDAEVGLTITTDNDRIREIFEPQAPPVSARIEALKKLHKSGINTYVFIGPVLPMDHRILVQNVSPVADSVIIDRMNYISKTVSIYKKYGLQKWLERAFVDKVIAGLQDSFRDKSVDIC